MRIISGKYKGKRLVAPKKLPVRPTTDMAKEGLFNILNNQYYFDELTVLDLFAGTGSISFEFASRGAQDIVSVDSHYACIKYIAQISEELDIPVQTIKSDAFKYLEQCNRTFDIIFADPPYNFDLTTFQSIVNLVFERELLNANGLLIIEHSKFSDLTDNQYFRDSRNYGGSVFSFFKTTE